MAKAASNPAAPAESNSAPPVARLPAWSELWQMPLLLAGVVLLLAWFALAMGGGREKDDFPAALDNISQYLQAGNYPQAQRKINEMLTALDRVPPLQQARLAQLRGDLIYLTQHEEGGSLHENGVKIVEFYNQAREGGQPDDPLHLQRWAMTHVALGHYDQALKIVEGMPPQPAQDRYLIVRQILERQTLSRGDDQRFDSLLARFNDEISHESEPQRRREQELWAVCCQAQRMLMADDPAPAMAFLQRQIIAQSEQGDSPFLAHPMLLLAQAYQRSNENALAQRWYREADKRMAPDDAFHAEVLVGLAAMDLAGGADARDGERNAFREALAKYVKAEENFPPATTPIYFDALVGRAFCEANLGQHLAALEHYARAADMVAASTPRLQTREDKLVRSVRSHVEMSMNEQHADYDLARQYLELLIPVYRNQKELPVPLLLDLASTQEKLARQFLAQANQANPDVSQLQAKPASRPQGDMARRVANQQAASHFSAAGDYFLRHAHALGVAEDGPAGQSLWSAAECYDKAQSWKKAIAVYGEYQQNRGNDPRRLEAAYRLALAYQADGQPGSAVELFRRLDADYPQSPEAYASLVPMAQCNLALNDEAGAQRTLERVIQKHPAITPQSLHYRQALLELSLLHVRREEYEPACQLLQEAVDRYGQEADGATLRFRLADAYRRSIAQIERDLLEPMPQSRQVALREERTRRLSEAQTLLGQAVSLYESAAGSLGPLESVYYRNAYFYRADCAYDLRRFEEAVLLYDLAAKRWKGSPAALVALVQIFNSYCEQGQLAEARVANRRARALLKSITDEQFNDPNLPMTRAHWDAWLRWTSDLGLLEAQASASR